MRLKNRHICRYFRSHILSSCYCLSTTGVLLSIIETKIILLHYFSVSSFSPFDMFMSLYLSIVSLYIPSLHRMTQMSPIVLVVFFSSCLFRQHAESKPNQSKHGYSRHLVSAIILPYRRC
jgi:hypothetical protein